MLKIISLLLLIILLFVINFKDKTIVNKNKLIKQYEKSPKTTKQLEDICKLMTNKKYIKLKNIKKSCKYISVTIPFKIRFEINFIINNVLKHINELFNYKTYFIEVEHLEVFEDNIGNFPGNPPKGVFDALSCDIIVFEGPGGSFFGYFGSFLKTSSYLQFSVKRSKIMIAYFRPPLRLMP